jgi:hypothetical protein
VARSDELVERLKFGRSFHEIPGCGEWFDMRDLGEVLEHVHDAEVEIGEDPPPTVQ